MNKAATAKKLGAAALKGGGGVGALGAGFYGVMVAEAKLARRIIGEASDEPPNSTGWYGRGRPGPAIRIALLGDSSAAGYGVQRVEETPGAFLASGVARHAGRRVYFKEFAVVGARSSDLKTQVDRALAIEPEVAVILVGGNDVIGTVLPKQSARYLSDAVSRLTATGAKVVVGTCPDLGTIQPIAPPLRQVARLWSRRIATAQTIATIETGGRSVSLGDVLGPEFAAAPALLFGPDRFHPSAEGYRALANVMLPSVLAALDEAPAEETDLETYRGEGVLPISRAALKAVNQPGTELDGSGDAGKPGGVRGRFVELRHRRRRAQTTPEAPAETENAAQENAT